MDTTSFHASYTVVLLVVFIGIVWWAFSRRRKKGFEEAARLPFEDEQHEERPGAKEEGRHD